MTFKSFCSALLIIVHTTSFVNMFVLSQCQFCHKVPCCVTLCHISHVSFICFVFTGCSYLTLVMFVWDPQSWVFKPHPPSCSLPGQHPPSTSQLPPCKYMYRGLYCVLYFCIVIVSSSFVMSRMYVPLVEGDMYCMIIRFLHVYLLH